ncbi:MAG: hypothetical protein MN733_41680 [Nitrososphaera sp.]|nr:hypothetical protein [Nitrososphaera sp.]
MTVIKLNKPEAARRQINAAIRMLFSCEDPVAIHTLAMAGFRILRDLASLHDDSYMENVIGLMIKPDQKADFWGAMNSFSNFLKHADKDPDGIHDGVEEQINDVTLLVACLYYKDLGHQFTPEMFALVGWFTSLHPHFLVDNANPRFRAAVELAGKSIKDLDRREQLIFGKQLIALARSMEPGP